MADGKIIRRVACISFAGIIQIRFPGIISAALQQHPDANLEQRNGIIFKKAISPAPFRRPLRSRCRSQNLLHHLNEKATAFATSSAFRMLPMGTLSFALP